MKKYKILSRLFFYLALILLGITIFLIVNPPPVIACPLVNQPCPRDYNYAVMAAIFDIIFWLGFIYFLRKSKKASLP